MKRERRAIIKDRTRNFAAGAIESLEPLASGRFDDLDLTYEEWLVVEEEMRAIALRVFPASASTGGEP